jgi:hypothetical protein
MTKLPVALRRLPYVFYGLAVLLFVWRFANDWYSISAMGAYADPTLEGMESHAKSQALFNAVYDAVWLLGNGAFLHVLIAIHDKLNRPAE